MIAYRGHADDSCRVLRTKAIDWHEVSISYVSFWETIKTKNLNGPCGVQARRKVSHNKPGIGEVTEPNQVRCWDISFLSTMHPYEKYCLYALLDSFSLKLQTSNDNPQIEALFSTVKNVPDYPGRFESIEEADHYFQRFFDSYNQEHYHTALNMVHPARVYAGK